MTKLNPISLTKKNGYKSVRSVSGHLVPHETNQMN